MTSFCSIILQDHEKSVQQQQKIDKMMKKEKYEQIHTILNQIKSEKKNYNQPELEERLNKNIEAVNERILEISHSY